MNWLNFAPTWYSSFQVPPAITFSITVLTEGDIAAVFAPHLSRSWSLPSLRACNHCHISFICHRYLQGYHCSVTDLRLSPTRTGTPRLLVTVMIQVLSPESFLCNSVILTSLFLRCQGRRFTCRWHCQWIGGAPGPCAGRDKQLNNNVVISVGIGAVVLLWFGLGFCSRTVLPRPHLLFFLPLIKLCDLDAKMQWEFRKTFGIWFCINRIYCKRLPALVHLIDDCVVNELCQLNCR